MTIGSKLYDVGSEKILTFSGVSFAKTIMCNENGYYSIYDSDRFGFNNPDDQWDQDLDFLLIGDFLSTEHVLIDQTTLIQFKKI